MLNSRRIISPDDHRLQRRLSKSHPRSRERRRIRNLRSPGRLAESLSPSRHHGSPPPEKRWLGARPDRRPPPPDRRRPQNCPQTDPPPSPDRTHVIRTLWHGVVEGSRRSRASRARRLAGLRVQAPRETRQKRSLSPRQPQRDGKPRQPPPSRSASPRRRRPRRRLRRKRNL